ncbi:MAG: bifunctional heptose 7-phosphate kinase/heptose 1-phosphate adenyltransferase [Bacteroidia bacterium]
MNISQLFKQFNNTKVLVLGDVMVDAYFYGSVSRISPEAPVPIVNLKSKEQRLGGAANVALNLKSLGAEPIICSIKGNDRDGKVLKDLCIENDLTTDGLINDYNRETTVKTRVIGNSHQLLRIDEESTHDIDASLEDLLFNAVKSFISEIDVLIFQDYNKGLLTPGLIRRVIALCKENNIPMVVDPKFNNFYEYEGVTLFKPNKKELQQAENIGEAMSLPLVKNLASDVRNKLNADKIMTTLSEDGVLIVSKNETTHLPAHPRKIVDVSGAGDSVLSVAALCVAAGIQDELIAALSNLAGGIVCEQVGVVPIDRDLLLAEAMELNVASGY